MRPGLADPVVDSQAIFRAVLEAMAHPGRIENISALVVPPPPLHAAAAALALTLVDFEMPLWLDEAAATPEAVDYLKFHTGAPIVGRAGEAGFALVAAPARMPVLSAFDAGTDEEPERAATLIIQVEALAEGRGRVLTGPGIAGQTALEVLGLPDAVWAEMRENHASFPRGVDLIFTAGTRIAALPRTTRVEDA